MKQHRRSALLIGAGLLGLALAPLCARSAGADAATPDIAHGKQLAIDNCSRCHAVEPGGKSPLADAPPFYVLGQRYPLDDLEEALAEGIMVGHEGIQMPEFQFSPDDIADLIAYMKSIQVPAKPRG